MWGMHSVKSDKRRKEGMKARWDDRINEVAGTVGTGNLLPACTIFGEVDGCRLGNGTFLGINCWSWRPVFLETQPYVKQYTRGLSTCWFI